MMRKLYLPKGIIIHHSLTKDSGTVSWPAIRAYHMIEKKWNDIGYHFGVEIVSRAIGMSRVDNVECLLGRPPTFYGAHTRGKNDRLGVCVVGNFDLHPPPPAVWDKAVSLVAHLVWLYLLTVKDVTAHRNYSRRKSCPGKRFDMSLFKEAVLLAFYKLPDRAEFVSRLMREADRGNH